MRANLFFKTWFAMACLCSVMGCERPLRTATSRVGIKVPSVKDFEAQKLSGKVQAFAAIDYNLLCYYANITATDITSTTDDCLPARGIFGGGVTAGQVIDIEVPSGSNRTIELFGFLRVSTAEPCPIFSSTAKPSSELIYELGKTTAVTVSPPVTEVSIDMILPPKEQNMRAKYAWNTCPRAPQALANLPMNRTQLGAGFLNGNKFKMSGQISLKQEGPVLKGNQFKIHSWIAK